MNDELYLKKLKSEYEYLKAEVQYQANLFVEAKGEFDKRFTDKLNLNVPESKKIKEEKTVRKKSLDKVYKKLAQKIHPDKKTGDSDDFKKLIHRLRKEYVRIKENKRRNTEADPG